MTREGLEVLIWRSVTKRQETRRRANKALTIEDVKYNAKWDDKPGDYVEVVHPSDKRSRVVGQVEYLFTKKADGLYPCQGTVVLVRPFEGLELEFETSSIVKKIDANEWKRLLKQIQEKLPNSLEVYHQYRDENGAVARSIVTADSPFLLEADVIAKEDVQISVDVLDETGAYLLDNDKDKTRVLRTKHLIVKLELFNANGEPIRDPKGKRGWFELLRPYQSNESKQYNTGASTKQFTPLCTMLSQQLPRNSRAFQLEISLIYDNNKVTDPDNPFHIELLKRIEGIKCRRSFEIMAGIFRNALETPLFMVALTRGDWQVDITNCLSFPLPHLYLPYSSLPPPSLPNFHFA